MLTTQKLFSFAAMLLFSCALFGQQEDKEQADEMATIKRMKPLMHMTNLIYQGKFAEALPVLNRYVDSMKRVSVREPKQREQYLDLLGTQSFLYSNTGNFYEAEKLLKEVVTGRAKLKDKDNHYNQYKHSINSLALLYEKMGNYEGAENLLEQMVVMEYGNHSPQNEKEQFFNYYRKIYSIYHADPKKIDEQIEQLWNSYQHPDNPGNGEDAASANNVKAMMRLQMSFLSPTSLPTAAQLSRIRNGTLKLGGGRNALNFSDPWNEVRRLFNIYVKLKNYFAAEVLIKEAIAIDENASIEADPMSSYMKTIMSPQVLDLMVKKYGMKEIGVNMKQIVGAGNKYGGVDIFYIQNKVLLAELYKNIGKNAAYKALADAIYRQCRYLDTTSNPMILTSLADAYIKIEKYRDAEFLYKKIVSYHKTQTGDKIVSSQAYIDALQKLGQVYQSLGDYGQAKQALEQALAFDRKTSADKYPDHMNRVINLAQLYENTNQLKTAEQYCTSALGPVMSAVRDNFGFLSEREKIALMNNSISAFDFSASLLLTDPYPQDGFAVQTYNQQLLLKGLVLNDQAKVLETVRKSGNPALKRLLSDWQSNRSAIAWQYSQPKTSITRHLMDSLNAVSNEQEKRITQLSESFRNGNQNNQVDFKRIQQYLPDDEAAVEFVRFNYYHKKWTDTVWYAAFVILKDKPTPYFVPLCTEEDLAEMLKGASFFGFYGNENIKPGQRKSDILYNLIWKPISGHLAGIKKIAISPAGLLNRISFAALPYNRQSFLTDKYDIRQYTALNEIAGQKTSRPYAANAVLFGGINYDIQNERYTADVAGTDVTRQILERAAANFEKLEPLPGTLSEVNRIGKILEQDHKNVQVITGAAATEKRFKLLSGNSPWILHIATHGFWLPNAGPGDDENMASEENQFSLAGNPMFRSGILMAGANRVWTGGTPIAGLDDGIVTAYEISNLDLSNTELVVLSACKTAMGDIKGTEGVFGLQRSLKLAGVKNMLLSLWPVPDEQTSELMESFYAGKLKGIPDHQALKNAQDELRKKYSPYYWAAFELIE